MALALSRSFSLRLPRLCLDSSGSSLAFSRCHSLIPSSSPSSNIGVSGRQTNRLWKRVTWLCGNIHINLLARAVYYKTHSLLVCSHDCHGGCLWTVVIPVLRWHHQEPDTVIRSKVRTTKDRKKVSISVASTTSKIWLYEPMSEMSTQTQQKRFSYHL